MINEFTRLALVLCGWELLKWALFHKKSHYCYRHGVWMTEHMSDWTCDACTKENEVDAIEDEPLE